MWAYLQTIVTGLGHAWCVPSHRALTLALHSPFLPDSSRIGAVLLIMLAPEVSCCTGYSVT